MNLPFYENNRGLLNLEVELRRICQEFHFQITSNKEFKLTDRWEEDCLKAQIEVSNSVLRNNLVLVDSKMPMILFAFASSIHDYDSLSSLADRLTARGFPHSEGQQSRVYLRYKSVVLLESLLYCDSLLNNWTGRFHTRRVYVSKTHNGEFEYFNHLEMRNYLFQIIDFIFLKADRIPNGYEIGLFSRFGSEKFVD